MADLKAMFAKKGEPKGADVSPADATSPAPNVGTPNPAKRNPFARPNKAQPNELAGSPAAGETPREAPPSSVADSHGTRDNEEPLRGPEPDSGREAAGDQPSPAGDSPAKPRLAGFRFGAGSQPSNPDSGMQAGGTIDSLADLDESEDAGVVSRGPSQFEDETPATKPTRELPADMDKSSLQFVDLIDGVYEIIHDPELLGNVIRSIMIELKANPQYTKLIADDDVRTWVRAMRDSMGLARVKKVEAKARRSGSKTKSGSKAVDDDMLADLADLGVSSL